MARVAVALGSNLGDREETLAGALRELAQMLRHLRASSFHDTEPVGVGVQPRFLNAAAVGETALSPFDCLRELLSIERRFGRQRPSPGAARTLDLDLILYNGLTIAQPGLIVPHPRFRERRFVLAPLAEVADDWRDPVTGFTVGQLLLAVSEPPRGGAL